jgi:hypothetical protein
MHGNFTPDLIGKYNGGTGPINVNPALAVGQPMPGI